MNLNKLNASNLSHPVVQARIYAAMRLAVNASNGMYQHQQKGKFQIAPGKDRATVYIANKSGHNFLRVTYDRKGLTGFRFYCEGGECTAVVLASLWA